MVHDLPLHLVSMTDEDEFYVAVLQVGRGVCGVCVWRGEVGLLPWPTATAQYSAWLAAFSAALDCSLASRPACLAWQRHTCVSSPAQVPEGYAHPAAPIRLSGRVIHGFGRGSKKLGVPTANLPPAPLAQQLAELPAGVYFG